MRMIATILLLLGIGASVSKAQLLALPVADLPRRELMATYDDLRSEELEQKILEYVYDFINGTPLKEKHFRDASAVLGEASDILRAAEALGYAADDLLQAFDGAFLKALEPDFDPFASERERLEQVHATYRSLLASSQHLAQDIGSAALYAESIKGQVEDIGQSVFGITGLGNHQASFELAAEPAIASAEELLFLRQAIALETNADIIRFAEEVASDLQSLEILRVTLFGEEEGLPQGAAHLP